MIAPIKVHRRKTRRDRFAPIDLCSSYATIHLHFVVKIRDRFVVPALDFILFDPRAFASMSQSSILREKDSHEGTLLVVRDSRTF